MIKDANGNEIRVGDVGVDIRTGRPVKWDGDSFVYQDDADDFHPNINCAGGPGMDIYTDFRATSAPSYDTLRDALESIALSYPVTEEGETLAEIARNALKNTCTK